MKCTIECGTLGLVAAALIGGCAGAETDTESESELAQSISGGSLVSAAENGSSPYSSTVYLRTNSENAFCTASKIRETGTTDTYVTAAHCMWPYAPAPAGNSQILLANGRDSDVEAPVWSIQAIYNHPSAVSDPDTKESNQLRRASSHSYDVAVFTVGYNGALPDIPVLPTAQGPLPGFTSSGVSARMLGYGCDEVLSDNSGLKQKATLTTQAQGTTGADNYTRYLKTSGNIWGCPSDSGGPLSRTGNELIGVTSFRLGTAQAGYTTHFARVGNVARWIAAPHNGSAPFNGIGFIQARNARQCVGVPNRNVGTAALLYECEGYDPSIHHQLWELVPVTGTSFFKIRMGRSGANRCLSVRSGTNVIDMQLCTSGGQAQEWSKVTVSSTDTLHYKIRSRSTNLFLTPASGSGVFVTTASASNNDHWLFYR